jgi:hypothetical protein
LSATIFRDGASAPPGVDLPVVLTFQDAGGAVTTIAATLPASGQMDLLSGARPPARFLQLPGRVTVSASGENATRPMIWSQPTFTWVDQQINLQLVTSSTPSYFQIQGTPSISVQDPVTGSRTVTVVGSEIDVTTAIDVDVFTATVTGATGFIHLSDGTQIGFYNGEVFGREINLQDRFDSIGLSGASFRDAPSQSFSAPSVSLGPATVNVPALSPGFRTFALVVLLACGVTIVARKAIRRT